METTLVPPVVDWDASTSDDLNGHDDDDVRSYLRWPTLLLENETSDYRLDGFAPVTDRPWNGSDADQSVGAASFNWWTLWLLVFPGLTVFGNVLVVMGVYRERNLQSATNYYIVSLAIADIMVAILVMPLAVYVEVNDSLWELGDALCDTWVALDVGCCTASILNLTAISVDRFIAVTRPIQYAKHKNSYRVCVTLALTWVISIAISSPIALGMNYTEERRQTPTLCTFYNSDFLIFSSMGSFYIPSVVMALLYWRIFHAIRTRARKSRSVENHSKGVAVSCKVLSSDGHPGASKRSVAPSPVMAGRDREPSDESRSKSKATRMSIKKPSENPAVLLSVGANPIDWDADAVAVTIATITGEDRSPSEKDQCHHVTTVDTTTTAKCQPSKNSVSITMETRRNDTQGGVITQHHLMTTELVAPLSRGEKISRIRTAFRRITQSLSSNSGEADSSSVNRGDTRTANSRRTLSGTHRRERKATKTLAIVLGLRCKPNTLSVGPNSGVGALRAGVFLFCWVPFFTLNMIRAACIRYELTTDVCQMDPILFSFFVWLGYINSFLNPVIYTIFNAEFRRAFKRLLCPGKSH